MVEKTTYTMRFRRRREGKTDYRKRLAMLKSGMPRLVVRIRGKSVVAQIVNYNPKGDEIVVTATSSEIQKFGFKGHCGNVEASYLTGMLCGKKALKAGVKEVVFDIGLHTPVNGSNIFGALKGAVDAGLTIPHDEKCFPADDRVKTDAGKAAVEKIGKAL